jgi:FkbM family methyltransferase
MLNIKKIPEHDKIVFCGISESGVKCATQILNLLGDREYYFTDIRVEEVYEGEEFILVNNLEIPIISLERFYDMGYDVSVFCYSDYEKMKDKNERLQLHGMNKLHYMANEIVLEYFNALNKLENAQVYSKNFLNLMKELVVLWNSENDFPRFYRPHNREAILLELEKLSKAYELLEDDLSKQTFENILKYRFCGETKYLTEVLQENQYYPTEIFSFSEEEVIIDGGAAQGDSALKFIELCNRKYRKIYSFEANQDYCRGLKFCLKHENVQIIDKGLYDKNAALFWHEQGHGSYLSEEITSDIKIDVVSLDETIREKVTFIKMDIEGAEQKAILGAKGIIQRDKPKLAICVYHKEDDLWNIPLMIKELLPEYKIYMRSYYDVMDEETVCYACL